MTKKNLFLGLLIICVFILLGAGCAKLDKEDSVGEIDKQQKETDLEITQIPTDWQTYKNDKYGFQISWPGDWETGGPGFMNREWLDRTFEGIEPKPEAGVVVWGTRGGEVYILYIYNNPTKLGLLEWIQRVYDPKRIYEWKSEKNTHDAIQAYSPNKLLGEWSELPFPVAGLYMTQTDYIIGFVTPQEEVLDFRYPNSEERNTIRRLIFQGLRFK